MGNSPWNAESSVMNRISAYADKNKKKKNTRKGRLAKRFGLDPRDLNYYTVQQALNPLVLGNPYTASDTFANSGYGSGYASAGAEQQALIDAARQSIYGNMTANSATVDPRTATDPTTYTDRQGGGKSGGGSGGDGIFNEWTGFAGDYTGGGRDIIFDNPRILVRDMLKKLGFKPDDGMIDILSQDADTMEYLQMLTAGAGKDSLNSLEDEDFINFVGDWAKQMTTPGAGSPDSLAMLQNVLDAPEGSALAALMADGTPQQQAAMLNNLIAVAGGSLTPLAQRALMASLEGKTDDWLSSKAKGGKDPLANWIQKGGGGIFG